MAEETITILKVGTDEAVKSVNDLKSNVKTLKETLGELEIGTQEYQDTLDELKVNQNALKDAMYATSSSMDDLSKSATGTSESYNSLVHRMAALKEELRATDVSTEQGKQKFQELATAVNQVNDRLKEMDAMQGNFQRNVGNYQSAFKGMAGSVDALDKGFHAASGGLGAVKGGFEALSANPAVASFAIIVSVAMKLATALKDNETAMAGVKKGMDALKPVMDFISGVTEKLVSFLADLITKAAEFIGSSGIINKIIAGVMGVGNAVLQFVIAPFKGIVKAIGVLKDQGLKGIKDAAKAFGDEMKNGVSFQQNFKTGQSVSDAIIAGVSSKKEEVKAAAEEVMDTANNTVAEKLADLDKLLAEGQKRNAERLKQRLDDQKLSDELYEEEMQAALEDIDAFYAEQAQIEEDAKKKSEETSKARIATINAVANATSSILNSIADMYESDEENAEKNAEKVKALRIASATIDTITGAVGAFMQASSTIPPPFGQIIGGVTAAAVVATGIAQIAQIKKQKVSGGASSSGAVSAPAMTAAPTVQTEVSNVRAVTGASEEERLNQMASPQRVYILSSDIEASQNQIKTQVAESSF